MQASGALEIFVPDEHWRQCVANLIRRATLIVVRIGAHTESIREELEMIRADDFAAKTLAVRDSDCDPVAGIENIVSRIDAPADTTAVRQRLARAIARFEPVREPLPRLEHRSIG